MTSFLFAFVYADIYTSNPLRDLWIVSCIDQRNSGPEVFLSSYGMLIVLQRPMLLGFSSTGQRHLRMFPVYYISVKGCLVLDVLSL